MDPIKEAFAKIKEDIFFLKEELSTLKNEISLLRNNLSSLPLPNASCNLQPLEFKNQTSFQEHFQTDKQTHNPTDNSASKSEFNTDFNYFSNRQTDQQTDNLPLKGFKTQNLAISTGNKGVPTDKQTNQPTDSQTQNSSIEEVFHQNSTENKSDFQKVSEIITSLDTLKKGIRLKFKRLTPQEMAVFSALYTLEEENTFEVTYRTIAHKLNLSESSIRDYTNKLINKGIPINKIKQNNKTIILGISPDLKNIASLATIQSLRDL